MVPQLLRAMSGDSPSAGAGPFGELTAAVVGAGRMGRRHLHAVRKLGLPLVGVVDRSQDALREAANEHSLDDARLFRDMGSLYDSRVPNVLVVSTTADSHCALTCEAAARGVKFVLVEKPMAVSVEECDRMIATCSSHGTRLAVNHQMRFMEQYTRPRALLESDEYGGFKSMTIVAGNFGMSMNGTHYVEAFRYMAAEPVARVAAWFSDDAVPNPRGARFEDRAGALRAVTATGKRLYMDISSDQGHGVQVTYAGRNGIITVNELTGDMTTSVREAEYRDLPTTRYGMPARLGQERIAPAEVIDSTAAVLKALLTGTDSVEGEHGRLAVQVLAAAHSSAEQGGVECEVEDCCDPPRSFPWA